MSEETQGGESQLMDFEGTRALRYCELFVVGPEWITVYNSIGLSEAPADLWESTDAVEAAKTLGGAMVVKNGPHWWMADKVTLKFSVKQSTVNGISYRVAAKLPAFLAKSGNLEPPFYTVVEADKVGVNTYLAGKLVYELVSPEGAAFVMQSTNVEPSELDSLADKLKLADGWQYRARKLEEDLVMSMDGKVKVVMDDLKNVYNFPA